jgi:hypothetical protein
MPSNYIMPDIMIRCPVFGRAVPTGLTTEAIKFASLSDITVPMRCPACLRIHKWEQKDAWVDGNDRAGKSGR